MSDDKLGMPEPNPISWWTAHRRPLFVTLLAFSLLLILSLLPHDTRAALALALRIHQTLVGLLLLFLLITLSLVWTTGGHLDTRIFLLFNLRGYHPAWMDRLMLAVTQLGSVWGAVGVVALFALLHYRRLAIVVILGTFTLWLLVESIKALTDRVRPFHVLEKARVIGRRERGLSFPSGHTSQTFFLAILISSSFRFNADEIIILYAAALLIGFTRIYVGAHYPRDVLGGAILGTGWGGLAILVYHQWLG